MPFGNPVDPIDGVRFGTGAIGAYNLNRNNPSGLGDTAVQISALCEKQSNR